MSRKTENKVSLKKIRLQKAIKSAGYQSNVKFKTAIRNNYQGSSSGVSETKICAALRGDLVTERTAKSIAKFLSIDLDYLTGKQLRPTVNETNQVLRDRAAMMNSIPFIQATSFAERYNWHIVFDDPVTPSSFSVFDPDDTLICSNRDIKDLEAFTEAINHLLLLGEDITYRFLGDLYTPNNEEDPQ